MIDVFCSCRRRHPSGNSRADWRVNDPTAVSSPGNALCEVLVEVLYHGPYALLVARFGLGVLKKWIVGGAIYGRFDRRVEQGAKTMAYAIQPGKEEEHSLASAKSHIYSRIYTKGEGTGSSCSRLQDRTLVFVRHLIFAHHLVFTQYLS